MNVNMKRLRKEKGLTQEELAKLVDATKRQIGAWERGENDLPLDYADSIASVLGCTLDELAGRADGADGLGIDPYPSLTRDERELLSLFRSMGEREKALTMENARAFAALSVKDGAGNPQDVGRAGIVVTP